jgi:hypothetical protein
VEHGLVRPKGKQITGMKTALGDQGRDLNNAYFTALPGATELCPKSIFLRAAAQQSVRSI